MVREVCSFCSQCFIMPYYFFVSIFLLFVPCIIGVRGSRLGEQNCVYVLLLNYYFWFFDRPGVGFGLWLGCLATHIRYEISCIFVS